MNRIGMNLWTLLTAACLQISCYSYSRGIFGRTPVSSSSTFPKELKFNNLDVLLSRNLVNYCTSIDRNDAEEQINKTKKKPQRFIHPQVWIRLYTSLKEGHWCTVHLILLFLYILDTKVFKMFHRAQFLVRQGDNLVAQKLLVWCLELNPFDSHRWGAWDK